MPHHVIAQHLRRIAACLDGSPAAERGKIERLADAFDGLVNERTGLEDWLTQREWLLSAAQDVASAFERRTGPTSQQMAIAMREFAEAIQRLRARD